jgi:hypothetical protein
VSQSQNPDSPALGSHRRPRPGARTVRAAGQHATAAGSAAGQHAAVARAGAELPAAVAGPAPPQASLGAARGRRIRVRVRVRRDWWACRPVPAGLYVDHRSGRGRRKVPSWPAQAGASDPCSRLFHWPSSPCWRLHHLGPGCLGNGQAPALQALGRAAAGRRIRVAGFWSMALRDVVEEPSYCPTRAGSVEVAAPLSWSCIWSTRAGPRSGRRAEPCSAPPRPGALCAAAVTRPAQRQKR